MPEILLGIYAPEELSTRPVELVPSEPPPRPRREDFVDHRSEPPAAEPAQTFAVVDNDGVETEYATAPEAANELALILADAAKHGIDALEGAWESNEPIMRLGDAAGPVLDAYNALHAKLTKPSSARDAPESSEAGKMRSARVTR